MMVDTDAEDVFTDGSCCGEPNSVRKNTFPVAPNMSIKLPHFATILIRGWESKLVSRELIIFLLHRMNILKIDFSKTSKCFNRNYMIIIIIHNYSNSVPVISREFEHFFTLRFILYFKIVASCGNNPMIFITSTLFGSVIQPTVSEFNSQFSAAVGIGRHKRPDT